MAIQSSELIWRKAALTSDTTAAQNGGRMITTPIVTDTRGALFPDVKQAQRDAGAVHHRKAFIHVASADNVALLDARVYVDQATPADDFITLHLGTQTDTQDAVVARPYGAAALNIGVSSGASSLQIVPDGLADMGALEPFQAGDLIRISDGINTEYHTVDTVTDNTTHLTIALDGSTLGADYAQAGTVVSSVIEIASTLAAISTPVVTSTAGTLNAALLVAHNKGALNDAITLSFSSATAFTASGANLGSLGTGNISSTFSPTNPGTSSAYFTIPSTAWGGTFAGGDTVTFNLSPASIPLWYRRQVPAGADSLANNSVVVGITGESAS